MRRGFTLIELLVVILIVVLVSVVTIPLIVPAFAHRQSSEGARVLQGALVGARDEAVRTGRPAGIRLLPDPSFSGIDPTTGRLNPNLPLAAGRIVPLAPAPGYSEGLANTWVGALPASVASLPYPVSSKAYPNPTYGQTSALMIWQSAADPVTALPNNPTSWMWNIRLGDQIKIGMKTYTVVGPMVVTPANGNSELFVNVGPPGTLPALVDSRGFGCDVLFVVNGRDDNGNGWVDEGWDGIDNNNNGVIDEIDEWEVEAW